ncbi:MAG TPA: CoA pyrophosphatase [Thermoanaerobaculaceae bacterium]|nr:CoA pyrophosphatase [Thermoanaerobaculaceae bacterium]
MGTAISIADVRRALGAPHQPARMKAPPGQTAAVAAVLRETGGAVELLFIVRAEHPRDPWSGHVAFPGGRVDPTDADALATAVRETSEELALDLERDAALLGALPAVRTHLQHGPGPLWVAPFVFQLLVAPGLVPNEEVQEALWVPLEFLADAGNRGRFLWDGPIPSIQMPCVRYDGRLIWGLTLRIVDLLLSLAGV